MVVPEENMDLPDYTEGARERIGIEERHPKHVRPFCFGNIL
jgi:hypothetical protein